MMLSLNTIEGSYLYNG